MLRRAMLAVPVIGIAAALAACASGQSGGSAASSSSGATADGAGWGAYFFPAKQGYQCTSTISGKPGGNLGVELNASGRGVEKVASVRSDDTGRTYTIATTSHTTTTVSAGGKTQPPKTVDQSIEQQYVLGSDGQLEVRPPKLPALGPLEIAIKGNTHYPSVTQLRAGGHTDSTVTVSLTSTDETFAKQLRSQTSDGSATLRIKVTLRATAFRPGPVKAAGKTYDDTLGLRVKLASKAATNLSGESKLPAALDTVLNNAYPNIEAVFARGVGPVDRTVETAVGTIRSVATRCGG